jgi:hypothetical protein
VSSEMTSPASINRTKVGATFNIPVELDLREAHGETISAHLLQVNTGFFQLACPVFLQSNTTIDISFDRQRREVEVVFCKADHRIGYLVGARLMAGLNGEIRREPRIPIEISARLTTSDLPGSIPAKVVDISRSGLGLRVPRNIPVGVGVIVELHSGIAFGEVRHSSKKTKDSWRVGLSLDEFIARRDRSSKGENEASESSAVPFIRLLKRMFK